MQEIVKEKWIIELEGGAQPFYISGLNYGDSPSFTANVGEAVHYNSQARAWIDRDKVKAAGFTMSLNAKPLTIKYIIGGN